jgi:putative permease
MHSITNWFKRYFSDPQVVFLAVMLLGLLVVVLFMGNMLAPFIASIIIAYLLEGLVRALERRKVPRLLAVILVFSLFLIFLLIIMFGLFPVVSRQLKQLFDQVPVMFGATQKALLGLPVQYPEFISKKQIEELITALGSEMAQYGQTVLSISWSSVVGLITFLVYLILVPMLVFFFLKDKSTIIAWLHQYLPKNHQLAEKVWNNVDGQIGNYVRGKFWEILIVWAATYLTFSVLNVQFSMLLSVVIGLSVLVPFVGAAVVTVPVILIAWYQFGWSVDAAWVVLAHLVIQGVDGNIIVPLLFSEVVNLHPIAIIVAILVFGGIWGVWGVFFAIPLATLVQAVLTSWPREIADNG